MKKYNKYLKYLKKNLAGGENKNLKFYIMLKDTTLWHGTYNKIIGNFATPVYFSNDISQSVGHIIYKYIDIYDNLQKLDKINTQKLKINLDYVSNYYPNLLQIKLSDNLNLLRIINPNNYNETFAKLYDSNILAKYIFAETNSKNIIEKFIEKIRGLQNKTADKMNDILMQDTSEINKIISIVNLYLGQICSYQCFGGWGNTPGYFLLNSINYNNYFQELKIIQSNEIIDGIYVEQDQSEIILFDTKKIYIENDFYLLPYSFGEDIKLNKLFIQEYITKSKEYIENKDEKYIDYANFLIKFAQKNTTEIWDISWFLTKCENYKPLEKIYDETKLEGQRGCSEKENVCHYRQSLKNIYNDIYDGFTNCGDFTIQNYKSSKISVSDEQLQDFKLYLDKILLWNSKYFNLDIQPITTQNINRIILQ